MQDWAFAILMFMSIFLLAWGMYWKSRSIAGERWIDEIVEALQDPDEVQGERSVHGLLAERDTE
jgi:hypothetical protein